MQVSNTNNQYLFLQQRASTKSSNPRSNYDQDALAGISSSAPTQYELKTGFFGSPRARLESVLASGLGVNSLSFLTSSDIDLVQRTTGVTIKDGGYYDSDGNRLGIHSDSHGNLLDPDPSKSKAAFDLAESLAEMRMTGGPQGDASLKNGRAITTDDFEAYLKAYAAAKASGQNTYVPNADVIRQAEKMLESE
jgi:hypothetical protein